jgi:hypothetical protein
MRQRQPADPSVDACLLLSEVRGDKVRRHSGRPGRASSNFEQSIEQIMGIDTWAMVDGDLSPTTCQDWHLRRAVTDAKANSDHHSGSCEVGVAITLPTSQDRGWELGYAPTAIDRSGHPG